MVLEMQTMEEESEQGLETASVDNPLAASPAETPDSTAIRRALSRLLRKRVKKFVKLVPEVRTDANPKTVHDARVWSRRLQQAITAFFPKPRSGKVRRLRRMPRRIRRGLGEWRNCDVLLEIVARQRRRTRSEAKRRAWDLVRDYLLQRRDKAVARAEKKLLRQDLRDYGARAQKLIDRPPDESPEVLMQRLSDSVRRAWSEWQSALSRALETRAVGDLHALRIATKDLRYRTELLYDVGYRDVKAQLKSLADLQEILGVWHDRQVLNQAVARALARPEFLLEKLQGARILLAELERDRSREAKEVEEIFRLATNHPGRRQMESWSESRIVTPVEPNK
jgi:CHAD domain-containing protein